MNVLDQVIGWISPETGYRREIYRQALEAERGYDAAGYDRENANWRAINESAEMTDQQDRDLVRARARDLERNSDVMNSVLGAHKRNIFGADTGCGQIQVIMSKMPRLKSCGKHGAKRKTVM